MKAPLSGRYRYCSGFQNRVLGLHVIINRGCLIGHHVQIGDYVTISPGVNIARKSKIGDLCFIGMSAVILDGISVGANSVVASGAVVTKDVPASVQVMGIPARVTKEIVIGTRIQAVAFPLLDPLNPTPLEPFSIV